MPASPARGDEQSVERYASMILELDDPLRWVDTYGSRAEDRPDVVVSVERDWAHQRLVEGSIAAKIGLRERRPLVRRLRLGTDQGYGPTGPLLTQRNGGRGAGQARADDDVVRHQTSICSESPSTRVR